MGGFIVVGAFFPPQRLSLLLIKQLDFAGYTTTFRSCICTIFTNSTTIIANHSGDLGMHQLHYAFNAECNGSQCTPIKTMSALCRKRKSSTSTTQLTAAFTITIRFWHQWLAHLHSAAMQSLIDGFEDLDGMCDVYLQAEYKQKVMQTKVKRDIWPFELRHSDTCDWSSIPTKEAHLQYILFLDNYTQWNNVDLLPDEKQESCIAAYQHYHGKVDSRGYNIERFRCYNGAGEYHKQLFRILSATDGPAPEFCPL